MDSIERKIMNISKEDEKIFPLGVKPQYYYEKERICDLARAIFEYVKDDIQDEYLITWTNELTEKILKWNTLLRVEEKK